MDYKIMNAFYQQSSDQLIQDILGYYKTHRSGIINYAYGAIMVNRKLLDNGMSYHGHNIKDILLDSTFLLPDGAALRTMRLIGKLLGRRKGPLMLHNLNGTDFLPYLLNYLHDFTDYKVNIITLTVYDPRINNPKGYLKDGTLRYAHKQWPRFALHGEEILYGDTEYGSFDWSDTEAFLTKHNYQDHDTINLFLNFRGGSYGGPHQELFAYINNKKLQDLQLLCMNQGATVDFWVGRETRAPKWIRALRLESVYRLFSDPKLNWKKFLISFRMISLIVSKVILSHERK
ncbi:MAG: WecB/TagA/CpsF family glycosyltransferase [Candidatus Absconditabacterales bacterium]